MASEPADPVDVTATTPDADGAEVIADVDRLVQVRRLELDVVPASEPGQVRVAAADGIFASHQGFVAGIEGTLYGATMSQRCPVIVENLATDPRATSRVPAEAGPCVLVPMLTDLAADGVLSLCRRPGEPPFDTVDVEMIQTYAAQAALVLQLSRSRRDNEQLRRADDREHIAVGLHPRRRAAVVAARRRPAGPRGAGAGPADPGRPAGRRRRHRRDHPRDPGRRVRAAVRSHRLTRLTATETVARWRMACSPTKSQPSAGWAGGRADSAPSRGTTDRRPPCMRHRAIDGVRDPFVVGG
jgi:hypothetical protein